MENIHHKLARARLSHATPANGKKIRIERNMMEMKEEEKKKVGNAHCASRGVDDSQSRNHVY